MTNLHDATENNFYRKTASPRSFGENNVRFKVQTETLEHKHSDALQQMSAELQFPVGEGSLLELRDEALEVRSERETEVLEELFRIFFTLQV